MKTKTIKQEVSFRAEAQKVYDALMDSKKHSQFTGSECVISKKAGGKFTAYGGYIKGVNLELVPGKKIVQSWRASDWPEGHYSKAIFILERKGKNTVLSFMQENVPEQFFDEISEGWKEHYWGKMKEKFGW